MANLSQTLLRTACSAMETGHRHYTDLRKPEVWNSLPPEVQAHITAMMDSILTLKSAASDGAFQAMVVGELEAKLEAGRQPKYLAPAIALIAEYLADRDEPYAALTQDKLPHGLWEHVATELYRRHGYDVLPRSLSKMMQGRQDRWFKVTELAEKRFLARVSQENEA